MAIQIKTLSAQNAVVVLKDDTGKQWAQIISGRLSDQGPSIPLPTGATYYGKYKFNVNTEFDLDDADVLNQGGVAYWGVEGVRR
jgi:hypothetical protein